MEDRSVVPGYMKSTVDMLQAAYPNGIPPEDYSGMIYIMGESGMSSRSIASALAYSYGGDYLDYLDAVWREDPDIKLPDDELERIRAKLIPFGYEEWAREE